MGNKKCLTGIIYSHKRHISFALMLQIQDIDTKLGTNILRELYDENRDSGILELRYGHVGKQTNIVDTCI